MMAKMRAQLFWGVIGPHGMPCLFGRHRADAEESRDFDERVARFRVEEVTPRRGDGERKPARPVQPGKSKRRKV